MLIEIDRIDIVENKLSIMDLIKSNLEDCGYYNPTGRISAMDGICLHKIWVEHTPSYCDILFKKFKRQEVIDEETRLREIINRKF
jgi:hypothetical protein